MNDFDKIIWSDTLVLVEFFASWCGPCRAMDPTVERFRRMMNGRAEVLRINIDDEQMLPIVRRYRIRTVPTLLLFHRGEERWRRSGITKLRGDGCGSRTDGSAHTRHAALNQCGKRQASSSWTKSSAGSEPRDPAARSTACRVSSFRAPMAAQKATAPWASR